MNASQKFVLCATMIMSAVSAQALAAGTDSNGETSPVLACFYDCRTGPGLRIDSWQEVTTIKLINQVAITPADKTATDRIATLTILDSNEKPIAITSTTLSTLDLDEIYICKTLTNANITPPTTGLVEIMVKDTSEVAATGVYAWMKNWLGKFMIAGLQPSQGYMDYGSLSKTECRVVPTSLGTTIPATSPPTPVVNPVYVDGTGE